MLVWMNLGLERKIRNTTYIEKAEMKDIVGYRNSNLPFATPISRVDLIYFSRCFCYILGIEAPQRS